MTPAFPAEAREVVASAQRRATALAERDPAALRRLLHPSLRWTTYRGDVLDLETYVAGNTGGDLRWNEQRLEDVDVAVVGDTAVLLAVAVDDVERRGERRVVRLRLTQMWVRTDGGWRCLAGHAGPELAPAPD